MPSMPTPNVDDLVREWAKESVEALNRAKKLKDPWTFKHTSKGTAVLSSGSPGLPFIITGTRPHEIQGHPVLRFMVQGQEVFARRVRHPGTKPDRDLVEAIDEIPDIGQSVLDRMIGNVN